MSKSSPPHLPFFRSFMALIISSVEIGMLSSWKRSTKSLSIRSLTSREISASATKKSPSGLANVYEQWRFPCGVRATPVWASHVVHVESCEIFDQTKSTLENQNAQLLSERLIHEYGTSNQGIKHGIATIRLHFSDHRSQETVWIQSYVIP